MDISSALNPSPTFLPAHAPCPAQPASHLSRLLPRLSSATCFPWPSTVSTGEAADGARVRETSARAVVVATSLIPTTPTSSYLNTTTRICCPDIRISRAAAPLHPPGPDGQGQRQTGEARTTPFLWSPGCRFQAARPWRMEGRLRPSTRMIVRPRPRPTRSKDADRMVSVLGLWDALCLTHTFRPLQMRL